jgi:TolB-like protein/Tfp pilus assembly protein PilF
MPSEIDRTSIPETELDIPSDEVRAALEKVLASESFGRVERPARFLRHLVETALRGDARVLKESVLGVDVFERPASWDPRIDPVVRQEAARLRKRLARYYQADGSGDAIRIELPIGTYVPDFRRSLVNAVDTEADAAPTNVAAASEVNLVAPPPARRSVAIYMIAGVVGISAIAAGLAWWATTHHRAALSIAVLPFTNTAPDPADQYFSDGLTDEVADSLARFKTLQVIPRTETFAFRKIPGNLRDVGRQLHASHLLRATVERAGDRINIVASLVRASDGTLLWTNTYRRHGTDVSDIEANLTEAVSATLGLAAPSQQKTHIPPAPAHDSFLKGRFEASQGNAEANLQAQADYRRALEIDPNYALAYAALASAIWNQNIWAGQSPLIEERRKSEELWQKALQLDPGYMPAHSGLAAYAMQYDWDWKRAEREYEAALSSGDSPGIEDNYALLCLIRGRRDEANRHIDRARELDPSSTARVANRVNFLELSGRLVEAREECRKWISRNENNLGPKITLDSIMAGQGATDAALANLSALPQDKPRVQMALAQVKAKAGDRDGALKLLASLERTYRDGRMFMYDFAIAYAEMGDGANAAKWMERSMEAREGPAMYIRVDPDLAKVQNNPDFRGLKKRMDLDW